MEILIASLVVGAGILAIEWREERSRRRFWELRANYLKFQADFYQNLWYRAAGLEECEDLP